MIRPDMAPIYDEDGRLLSNLMLVRMTRTEYSNRCRQANVAYAAVAPTPAPKEPPQNA